MEGRTKARDVDDAGVEVVPRGEAPGAGGGEAFGERRGGTQRKSALQGESVKGLLCLLLLCVRRKSETSQQKVL